MQIEIGQKLKRKLGDKLEVVIKSIEDGYVGIRDSNGMHFLDLAYFTDEFFESVEQESKDQNYIRKNS